jgi:hypothetical protein
LASEIASKKRQRYKKLYIDLDKGAPLRFTYPQFASSEEQKKYAKEILNDIREYGLANVYETFRKDAVEEGRRITGWDRTQRYLWLNLPKGSTSRERTNALLVALSLDSKENFVGRLQRWARLKAEADRGIYSSELEKYPKAVSYV